MADDAFGTLGEPLAATQRRVRMAARAVGRHGLGHAYGHISARLDDKSFLVCAPKPMGLIQTNDEGTVVPIEGPLPEGVLGEVRCHQQIYRRRPDVNGICRTFLRDTMTLSTMGLTPQVRHGFGTYVANTPLWDDPMLLRSDETAAQLAEQLGGARAIVMRGNGCILTGATVEEAIVMTFFLEEAAKTELAVLACGDRVTPIVYTPEQTEARAVSSGGIYERMWQYLTYGDPEA